MDSTKQQLRESLQKRRLEMSDEERHQKAEAITRQLFEAVDWYKVRTLHCFEPIMRLGEVDLTDFIAALQAGQRDIHVFTSRRLGGEWQVVSTDTDEPAAVPELDVVIVPMLGFDDRLHRIGYGGGYYDKFLAGLPRARKIGVCYEDGHLTHYMPVEHHDVRMDMIVTEDDIHTS
jgi:5-formyltetrahydrofolate cyclo-ligase